MGTLRRAGVAVAVGLAGSLAASGAHADEPAVKLALEAGTELDTNPHRETESYAPVPAAVGRGGIRISLGWRPAPKRALQLSAVAAGKKFVGGKNAEIEDVAVVAGDARYEARAESAPLALGARLSYYDAIERGNLASLGPDHDFRTGDAALTLSLVGESSQRVTLLAGVRAFQYKPDARYDFAGEHAQLEWRRSFEPDDGDDATDAPTWELGAWYGVARRVYEGNARIDRCATTDDPPDLSCVIQAPGVTRVDLAHNAGAELTYTGERIYSARYEAVISRSNSFGEGVARHRLELSATSETFFSIIVTARAIVQLNLSADPVLLSRDIGTIEDENRNSLKLLATRDLGEHWSIEARYALYASELGSQPLSFHRQTAYLGLVWRL